LSTWLCDGNNVFLWKEDIVCIIISWPVLWTVLLHPAPPHA